MILTVSCLQNILDHGLRLWKQLGDSLLLTDGQYVTSKCAVGLNSCYRAHIYACSRMEILLLTVLYRAYIEAVEFVSDSGCLPVRQMQQHSQWSKSKYDQSSYPFWKCPSSALLLIMRRVWVTMVVMVGWVIPRTLPKEKFSFSPVCDQMSVLI